MPKNYDFAGWVTKNDILCSDGVTIKQGAFAGNDGQQVPLVWQHDYKSNQNVLGHMILHNAAEGVYGFGYLNDTQAAKDAAEQLRHGDLNSMSIGAKNIKRVQPGNNVVHGSIYEVSLVLSPANSGALIDYVLAHSDEDGEGERAIVYPGNHILLSEDLLDLENTLQHAEGEKQVENPTPPAVPAAKPAGPNDDPLDPIENEVGTDEATVNSVLDTLNPQQMQAVETLIAAVIQELEGDDDEEDDSSDTPPAGAADDTTHQSIELEGEQILKHNAFEGAPTTPGTQNGNVWLDAEGEVITQSDINTIISAAAKAGVSSLSTVMADTLEHAGVQQDYDTLRHGLTNINVLFPTTQLNKGVQVYNPNALNVDKILGLFYKSPMSRVKNIYADLTEEDARARGYIKGNEKLDSIEAVYFRETTPGTVMRREKFDRDDIIDIQENGIDVVAFAQAVQKSKLTEEIVRAAFFGDGRPLTNANGSRNRDKISELHIRPIVTDDPLYTIKATAANWASAVDATTAALAAYQGSGNLAVYINPFDLAKLKTLKDANGRYLYGANMNSNMGPSDQNIAAYFSAKEVIPYRAVPLGTVVLIDLSDYSFGSAKGGEITNFEFFDIDFNQQKYLTETRLSGALQTPKSAIVLTVTDQTTGVIAVDPTQLTFNTTGVQTTTTWMTDTDPNQAQLADPADPENPVDPTIPAG